MNILEGQLPQIEQACFRLYNPQGNATERKQAEILLAKHFPTFSEQSLPTVNNSSPTTNLRPTDTALKCKLLLEVGTSPYTQMFALLSLKNSFSSHWNTFSYDVKIELRLFILNFLFTKSDQLEFSVISNLIQFFCLFTKLSWIDNNEEYQTQCRQVLKDVNNFLQSHEGHKLIGLNILSSLVTEMNIQRMSYSNISKHRKIAVNFRDNQLLTILETSISFLNTLLNNGIQCSLSDMRRKLNVAVMNVIKNCLSFDFIGTSPDETSEDFGTVQIPSSWKPIVCDVSTIKLFFDGYNQAQAADAALFMEALAILVSTRRSIFNNEDERSKFLAAMLQFTSAILKNEKGFDEQENTYEFCKFLLRIRTVHQFSELIEKREYNEWIELIYNFSTKCFQPAFWHLPSVSHLIHFWSKMVFSVSDSKGKARPASHDRLETLAGQLSIAFIKSRIELVDTSEEDFDEFLEEESDLISTMELLASVSRAKYQETCGFVKTIFNNLASQLNLIIWNQTVGAKFTVLVYIIGAFVSARPPASNSDDNDNLDGEIVCSVLQLMNVNENLVAQHGDACKDAKLDLALIYFFQMFRKSYIGDQSLRSTKVYDILGDTFQLKGLPMILNVLVQKLASNLKFWATNKHIVSRSLSLLSDISSGYSSVKLLRKTETAKIMLVNHTSSYFPFLDEPVNKKSRFQYYAALGRLLLSNDDNLELEFMAFVEPWTVVLNELLNINDLETFRSEKAQNVIEGIFRDLRGFSSSFQSKSNYMMFFNWFLPFTNVLLKGIQANETNSTSIAILKFFSEFVQNRSQRIVFEVSSPGGILLFREISKIICDFGSILQSRNFNPSTIWEEKYKGLCICFNMLRWSLVGKYVNFGVFSLYQDPAYDNVINMYFRLLISIPLSDLKTLPKLANSVFLLFQVFSSEQMQALPNIDEQVFSYMLKSSGECLTSSDQVIATQIAMSIESIFSFIVKQRLLKKQHYLVDQVENNINLVNEILVKLMELLFFMDHPSQWTMSRAFFPLVLVSKDFFDYCLRILLQNQLPENQEILASLLKNLMDGIEFNLLSKNRDRFTQQIVQFRRDVVQSNINLILPKELSTE